MITTSQAWRAVRHMIKESADFRTRQLLAGARQTHKVPERTTATPEQHAARMQPLVQHGGYDWSGYNAGAGTGASRDLSGRGFAGAAGNAYRSTEEMASSPYMSEINAARDRLINSGEDLSRYGVTRLGGPAPSPQTPAPAPQPAAPQPAPQDARSPIHQQFNHWNLNPATHRTVFDRNTGEMVAVEKNPAPQATPQPTPAPSPPAPSEGRFGYRAQTAPSEPVYTGELANGYVPPGGGRFGYQPPDPSAPPAPRDSYVHQTPSTYTPAPAAAPSSTPNIIPFVGPPSPPPRAQVATYAPQTTPTSGGVAGYTYKPDTPRTTHNANGSITTINVPGTGGAGATSPTLASRDTPQAPSPTPAPRKQIPIPRAISRRQLPSQRTGRRPVSIPRPTTP